MAGEILPITTTLHLYGHIQINTYISRVTVFVKKNEFWKDECFNTIIVGAAVTAGGEGSAVCFTVCYDKS